LVPKSVQAPHPLNVAIPHRAINATSKPLTARRRFPGIKSTSNAATAVPANGKPAVVDPESVTAQERGAIALNCSVVVPPPAGIVCAAKVHAASEGRSPQDNCTGCIYPVCGATAPCRLATPPTPTFAAPVTETLNPLPAATAPFTVSVSTADTLATEFVSPPKLAVIA